MEQILGLDLMVITLVLAFNFVFDIADLGCEKEIKSFSFILTATYGIYFVLRAFFGLTAAFITESTGVIDNPLVISIFSVIGSVSILQNFSLKVAGAGGFDMQDFFEKYKAKIMEDVHQKERNKSTEITQQVERELAKMDIEELKEILTLAIMETFEESEEWKDNRQKYLDYAKNASGGKEELERSILAKITASTNPQYVKSILGQRKKHSTNSLP